LSLVLALLLALALPVTAAEQQARLTFGVVPQQSATKLAGTWVPLLRLIEERSGVPLRFATAPDIPTFEQRLAAGEYDLAYMNPYHYTVFHEWPGYQAFAKEKDRRIQGILVVRRDSPYQRPADLQGRELAFPAPAAFAASVLVQAHLRRERIQIRPKYVSSHDSVYRGVAAGLFPAGGGVIRTFDAVDPSVRDQLRILWTTDTYTPHALAAHPRVPADAVDRLREAMVSLGGDEAGQAALGDLGFSGIAPARDAEWDDVRALRIDLLQPEGGE
jgi:phosphonate transport system substrate-binding protein